MLYEVIPHEWDDWYDDLPNTTCIVYIPSETRKQFTINDAEECPEYCYSVEESDFIIRHCAEPPIMVFAHATFRRLKWYDSIST